MGGRRCYCWCCKLARERVGENVEHLVEAIARRIGQLSISPTESVLLDATIEEERARFAEMQLGIACLEL